MKTKYNGGALIEEFTCDETSIEEVLHHVELYLEESTLPDFATYTIKYELFEGDGKSYVLKGFAERYKFRTTLFLMDDKDVIECEVTIIANNPDCTSFNVSYNWINDEYEVF